MESYKSQEQVIACDIDTIYDKLSNPAIFEAQINAHRDRLPQEAIANLDKVKFEPDAIVVESPMGPLRLAVDANQCQRPGRIVYSAAQSPVAFNMVIELQPDGEGQTRSVAALELDIPLFMRAMVGSQLKQAADKFGEMLAQLPYASL